MGPTPAGVPVSTISFGCTGKCALINSSSWVGLKIMSAADPFWTHAVFLLSENSKAAKSPQSKSATHDPIGQEPVNDFAMVQGWPCFLADSWVSRAVKSKARLTWEKLKFWSISSANSISWWISFDHSGSLMTLVEFRQLPDFKYQRSCRHRRIHFFCMQGIVAADTPNILRQFGHVDIAFRMTFQMLSPLLIWKCT